MRLKAYANVIVMALVFLGALSLYGAWYSQVGQESAAAASLETQIKAKAETTDRAQEAKNELAKALSDRSAITGYFVDTSDVVPFLETLQGTGAQLNSKVQVQSVSAQPAKPHTLLQLSLKITGTFDSVERTLGAIEYEPYDTSVTSLTLDTPGSSSGTAPVWTAAVTMNVGTLDAASSTPAAATSTTSS